MKLDYKCKFCQKPGSVNCGDDPVEHEAAQRWYPMLCCDRCGKFRVSMRKERDAVRHLAVNLSACPKAKLKEVEADCRPKLELILKRVTTLVGDYYRVQNIWDKDFVEQIIEKPESAGIIIALYVQGVSQYAKKP